MADCYTNAACEIDRLREGQRSTLRAVLGINIAMFAIELTAGLLAGSTALLADSLDMLGDALVYGFSLYVVARDDAWKAGSALLKGAIMGVFGLFVLGHAGYKLLYPQVPHVEAVGLIGLLALAANSVCLILLWRHRAEDVNLRSVWLCSRNDIIAELRSNPRCHPKGNPSQRLALSDKLGYHFSFLSGKGSVHVSRASAMPAIVDMGVRDSREGGDERSK